LKGNPKSAPIRSPSRNSEKQQVRGSHPIWIGFENKKKPTQIQNRKSRVSKSYHLKGGRSEIERKVYFNILTFLTEKGTGFEAKSPPKRNPETLRASMAPNQKNETKKNNYQNVYQGSRGGGSLKDQDRVCAQGKS